MVFQLQVFFPRSYLLIYEYNALTDNLSTLFITFLQRLLHCFIYTPNRKLFIPISVFLIWVWNIPRAS
jgi:hypothetical protein